VLRAEAWEPLRWMIQWQRTWSIATHKHAAVLVAAVSLHSIPQAAAALNTFSNESEDFGTHTNVSRALQETYSFLMTRLKCNDCCEKEWRACGCILGCATFKGKCDGINRPECEKVRECYARMDQQSPRAYAFEWQCDLTKCLAYCLRKVDICSPVMQTFRYDHCEKSLEIDLVGCDADCAGAPPIAYPNGLLTVAWLLAFVSVFLAAAPW